MPLNLFLFFVMMWPAVENTRSAGTDVAHTDKYFIAILVSFGYSSAFWFPQQQRIEHAVQQRAVQVPF